MPAVAWVKATLATALRLALDFTCALVLPHGTWTRAYAQPLRVIVDGNRASGKSAVVVALGRELASRGFSCVTHEREPLFDASGEHAAVFAVVSSLCDGCIRADELAASDAQVIVQEGCRDSTLFVDVHAHAKGDRMRKLERVLGLSATPPIRTRDVRVCLRCSPGACAQRGAPLSREVLEMRDVLYTRFWKHERRPVLCVDAEDSVQSVVACVGRSIRRW